MATTTTATKTLRVISKTPFKDNTAQLQDLTEDAKSKLLYFSPETIFKVTVDPKIQDQHYRFTLADGQKINGKTTWFVFKDHVKIE
ncbi:MAG TPA: hypothetical protein DEG17_26430 [Cyanobacteria bacterium UBA11149]|nr:hypothetical protein [Cyanobacteria bacterium UBA11367]HBE59840.1 hypothetical protein [Cyanobacteria bacterium UBA11366]HBR76115.1 hypothetical protein [Cyanobacteria bacterium UBA11159]HBS70609.1 hypothetical protein [Cyanobacteria bacterium UBA11153]HBW92306.1 hypothetical protein [Cyanobacteria bacterium UBA11149]HCA97799.1 hypothetical protein [Cyanobacteria bacterium UBA9226]